MAKQRVVVVAAVHGDDGTGIQSERIGQLDVAAFGLGEQHVGGQIVVVIEQHVRRHTALGTAEFGPRKQVQAESDGGGIEAQ
jgi:hypothetical protein